MPELVPASLILTVLNEESSLPAFLDSLSQQDSLPAEMVIVDGGSRDKTIQVIQNWSAPEGLQVNCFKRDGATISEGRNAAIAASTHDLIIITDGGTTLEQGWVKALYGSLASGNDVASGFFRPAGQVPLQRIIAAIITPTVDEIDPEKFLPSSRSVGFRKSWIERVGGYPEWLDYCEDLFLDLQLKRSGARFEFIPDAVATWNARPTLKAFAVQYYRYARGDAKAGLWPRRHLARYTAYTAGVLALIAARRCPAILPLVGTGLVMYLAKYFRRVRRHAGYVKYSQPIANAAVPLVVILGDVSKMAGYASGKYNRLVKGIPGAH